MRNALLFVTVRACHPYPCACACDFAWSVTSVTGAYFLLLGCGGARLGGGGRGRVCVGWGCGGVSVSLWGRAEAGERRVLLPLHALTLSVSEWLGQSEALDAALCLGVVQWPRGPAQSPAPHDSQAQPLLACRMEMVIGEFLDRPEREGDLA